MPKINDYSAPEISAQTGNIQDFGALRQPGEMGRVVQTLGNQTAQFGDALYRRKEQEEVSDLNAKFADAREKWTQDIQDQTQNGTIDTQNMDAKYQDFIGKMDTGISTNAGKNYFTKQAARLRGHVLSSSMRAQAHVAGAKAENDWRQALGSNSAALMNDPTQFKDVYDSSLEAIDAQVSSGAMPDAVAEKFKRLTGADLAQNTVRGWSKLSPDIAQKKLDAGEFDEYITGDTKQQLYNQIHAQRLANTADSARATKVDEQARKLKSESWKGDHMDDFVNHTLSAQDVMDSPDLNSSEKLRWINMVNANARKDTLTKPEAYNDFSRRLALPDGDPNKITDSGTLEDAVSKGVITASDFKKLDSFRKKTSSGALMNDNRSRLLRSATGSLVKKDPLMGLQDPEGEYNMMQYTNALHDKEEEFKKEKKPVGSLYDPNSPDYFGKEINKYKKTPDQIMKSLAGQVNQGSQIEPSQDGQPAAPPVQGDKRRIQGESPAAYLKRIGKSP